MDFNNGGQSSDNNRPLSAAEIARQKVLAAYSSTVDAVKRIQTKSNDQKPIQTPSSPQSSEQPSVHNPWFSQTTYTEPTQAIYTPNITQPIQSETYHHQTAQNANYSYQESAYYENPDYNTHQNQDATQTASNDYQPAYQQQSSYYANEQPYELSNNAYRTDDTYTPTINANSASLKDTPIDQEAINEEWQKYHSAWQDYYKKYYSDYYAKAAQTYLETEKMKTERIATGEVHRKRNLRRLIPVGVVSVIILGGLFLQYNRLIFAPIMAYISPDTGNVKTNIEAVDPTITQTVSADPRLIIPKLNIDVPVAFSISTDAVMEAMNHGVAQFSIPGASALPGQIGNLVLSGHSAGDIYSSNPYKFIFSGLERLENGDLIYVNYDSVRYTYQMTDSKVVEPTDVAALVYPTDKPILTLITCTPLGTSRYRLLITAEQISPAYTATEPSDPDQPVTDDPNNTVLPGDKTMPANEPSFFENLWQNLFGN